jgi:hypothetical protein
MYKSNICLCCKQQQESTTQYNEDTRRIDLEFVFSILYRNGLKKGLSWPCHLKQCLRILQISYTQSIPIEIIWVDFA